MTSQKPKRIDFPRATDLVWEYALVGAAQFFLLPDAAMLKALKATVSLPEADAVVFQHCCSYWTLTVQWLHRKKHERLLIDDGQKDNAIERFVGLWRGYQHEMKDLLQTEPENSFALRMASWKAAILPKALEALHKFEAGEGESEAIRVPFALPADPAQLDWYASLQ